MTRNTQAKAYKYSEIYDLFKKEQVDSFYVDGTNLVITLKGDTTADASATDTAQKMVTYRLYSFTVFYNDFNDMVKDQYARGVISSYDYDQGWQAPWWLSFCHTFS